MNRFLSRFNINIQVGLIGVTALLGFVLIGSIYFLSSHQQSAAQSGMALATAKRSVMKDISINLLQLRRHEKDFLLRHDATLATEHARVAETVADQMKNLANNLVPADRLLLIKIQEDLVSYFANFKTVVAEAGVIGLTENLGLRGELRKAVHEIESDVVGADQQNLMISMLMMRRHEKDFMERKESAYINALQQEGSKLENLLRNSTLSPVVASRVRDRLETYKEKFAQLAAVILRQEENVQNVSATFHEVEPQIEALLNAVIQRAVTQDAESKASQVMMDKFGITGLIGIALTTVLLAWLIGRSIAHSVMTMTAAMVALANGNRAIEIPGSGRNDEIGAMAVALAIFKDSMIEADQIAAEQAIDQAAKERRQIAMDQHTHDFGTSISGVMSSLVSSSGEMRQAASAMSQAASQVHVQAAKTASGAEHSSKELTTVAAAIEQMTASINEISGQVTAAAQVAREAVVQAEAGQTSIKELAETTSRIGDVVGLISSIARQTNLLALNATIEAARAGEAGKGFAVVAGEVKALAAQTAKATAEISSQITGIRGAAGSAIAAVEQIGTVIGRMEHVSSAIAAAVEEQSVTTREIAKSVQAINVAVEGAAQAMGEVVQNADQAGQVSQTVQVGADKIGQQAAQLRIEVGEFLNAVRIETGERRQHERLDGNGMIVKLQIHGLPAEPVSVRNISRSGISVGYTGHLLAGTEVAIIVSGHHVPVSGRVVRACVDGLLPVVFRQDSPTLGRVDEIMATLRTKQAA